MYKVDTDKLYTLTHIKMDKMTTRETLRQLRQIVNKFTPENFEELMESVADLKFDTVKKLWESIKLIFFKVFLEPSSIGLYAKMCCCLKEVSYSH